MELPTKTTKLSVKKFDFKTKIKFDLHPLTKKGPIIIVIGKTGSGKSCLILDIIRNFHKEIKQYYVVSESERLAPFFCQIIPRTMINYTFSEEIMNEIFEKQAKRSVAWQNKVNPEIPYEICRNRDVYYRDLMTRFNNIKGREDPRGILIVDDCMFKKNIFNTSSVRNFFFNGRHLRLIMIFALQAPLGLTPDLRTQLSYSCLYYTAATNEQIKIYVNYASIFHTFEFFQKVFEFCTGRATNHETGLPLVSKDGKIINQYGCMVVDNTADVSGIDDVKTAPKTAIERCVFSYVARYDPSNPLPDFQIENNEEWEKVRNEFYRKDKPRPQFDLRKIIPLKNRRYDAIDIVQYDER